MLEDPLLFTARCELEQAVRHLRAIPGAGEWTAQYTALRQMREPDAFPASDVGLMRALGDDRGQRPSGEQVLTRAEPWRPFARTPRNISGSRQVRARWAACALRTLSDVRCGPNAGESATRVGYSIARASAVVTRSCSLKNGKFSETKFEFDLCFAKEGCLSGALSRDRDSKSEDCSYSDAEGFAALWRAR